MDEDRYYNLGSHDKLFNQIDELTDSLASRDAEIAELRYRIELYEKALILSWPNGATGHAFDYWNSARKQDNDRS